MHKNRDGATAGAAGRTSLRGRAERTLHKVVGRIGLLVTMAARQERDANWLVLSALAVDCAADERRDGTPRGAVERGDLLHARASRRP